MTPNAIAAAIYVKKFVLFFHGMYVFYTFSDVVYI